PSAPSGAATSTALATAELRPGRPHVEAGAPETLVVGVALGDRLADLAQLRKPPIAGARVAARRREEHEPVRHLAEHVAVGRDDVRDPVQVAPEHHLPLRRAAE